MDRILACLALLVALVALLAATLSRRTPPEPAPAPVAAPAASRDDQPRSAAAPVASTAGVTADEVTHAWDLKMAAREEAICASVWPRVLRELRHRDGPAPRQPKTIDALLNLLLSEGNSEAEDAMTPEEKAAKAKTTACKNKLKQLGVYVALYESKFKEYPRVIKDMQRPDMITEQSDLLWCPVDGKSGYAYLDPFRGDDTPPDAILAYDEHVHADGTRDVLYFQGRVNQVNESDFQVQLVKQLAEERQVLSDLIVKVRAAATNPELTLEQREQALNRLQRLESVQR